MGTNYKVHLTATAEKDYENFHDEAQASIEDGELNSCKVSLFNSIDRAIDEILAISPISPERCLAGCLSFVYMLNLGLVCIYYLAYAEQGNTYILHIGPSQKGADLSWLQEAVANGEAEELFEQLGIEKAHLENAPKIWLN